MTERRDKHDVRILGIDDDAANLARVLKTDMLPALSRIVRLVHPIAKLDRIAHVSFTRADVNHVRTRWRNTDCTD